MGVGAHLPCSVLLAVWAPVLAVTYPLFGAQCLASLLPGFAVVFFSTYVHRYLHMEKQKALEVASPAMRWFLSSWYGSYLWQYHWMHHRHALGSLGAWTPSLTSLDRYQICNFNFLLTGDFVRGRFRRPSAKDVGLMKSIDSY